MATDPPSSLHTPGTLGTPSALDTPSTARSPAASGVPVINDDQLADLLSLLADADSVELKLTVPEDHQRSAVTAIGLDPLDAEVRIVHFFDTPELDLDRHGVVVRARRTQRKGEDTVVKLRPVVPGELPAKLRSSPEFVVEVDAMPGKHVCSGSLKGVPRRATVGQTIAGGPLRKLFSKEQRAFYAEHAPADIGLDDLSLLGPIFVLKLKGVPDGYARKIVAELWLYPDGSRVLELSTKCAPQEAFEVAARGRAFLAERGISRTDQQHTKTAKTLQYFADALRSGEPAAAGG
jgi:hypothetical protein